MHKKEVVKRAITFDGPPYLPKGELFIEKDFIESLIPFKLKSLEKTKLICELLELDLFALSEMEIDPKRIETLKDLFLVLNIPGPFSLWIKSFGFFETLKAMRKDKKRLLESFEKFFSSFKEKIPQIKDCGFDGIAILDDICGSKGLICSKKDFEEVLKPLYEKLSGLIKSQGFFLFFHSDGHIDDYLQSFLDLGVDCLHTFDSQAKMDLYEIKEKIDRRACFMGHIDLFAWQEEKIKEEIERAKREFALGGLVLGSSCGLSKEVPKGKMALLYPKIEEFLK